MYIVFSRPECTYCVQAVSYLKERDEEYKVINMNSQIAQHLKELLQFIDRLPGVLTVPQIFKIHDDEVQYDDPIEFIQFIHSYAESQNDRYLGSNSPVEYIGGYSELANLSRT